MAIKHIRTILNARLFFWATLLFFTFEAGWIALSAVYPMAFDEDFHFGIIQVYSHYWLPFLSSQPPHADVYGALARDPSYLYQYLMSYPYRLIALGLHNQMDQVIALRLLNIVLFVGGLLIFRRVLLRAGLSNILTNLSIFVFVLIPIIPQLAGQVNYDNLVFFLVAWVSLLTMSVIDGLRRKQLSAAQLLFLFSVCILGSLVKYEFLPIFAAIVIFLLYMVYKQFRTQPSKVWPLLKQSWRSTKLLTRVLLILFFLVGVVLFAQRDGYNLVHYHTFTPSCDKVLSVNECQAYSAWAASYTWHQIILANGGATYHNPLSYTCLWVYWLWYRLFFAINGAASGFQNYPPLPLPALAAALLILASPVVVYKWWRREGRKQPYVSFFLLMIGLYMFALWIEGYLRYRYTDVLVLMNGRYLLPVLLPAAVIIGKAFADMLRSRYVMKGILTVVLIFCFIQGGGVMTFILRSDKNWDWPNSKVVQVNKDARNVLRPIIIEGSKKYSTDYWVFN